MSTLPISVIIPSYKKEDMLVRTLKNNLPFLKGCEVVVVNDNPDASLQPYLKEFGDAITLVENATNLGFAGAVNRGVAVSSRHFVMLLNSDVLLKDTRYRNAVAEFQRDPDLFAVSFAQEEADGTIVGKNRIFWQHGFLMHERAPDILPGVNGWAEGGACMIHRDKFDELHGFDEAFSPFYWEDIDLSYRAWRRGWTILFDPSILVEHRHESTIGSLFAKQAVERIAYRNQLLFVWKNVDDKRLLASHTLRLGPTAARLFLRGNRNMAAAALEAFGRYPRVSKSVSVRTRTDRDVLSLFTQK
jgi:GT2 family glycosyltransferase